MISSVMTPLMFINLGIASTLTYLVHCNKVIHVHKKGEDSVECLKDHSQDQSFQPHAFCQSLDFVASQLGDSSENITIVIESTVKVKGLVVFISWKYFSIVGRNTPQAKVNCGCIKSKSDEKTVGLAFYEIKNLTLSNITVVNCCGKINNIHASVQLYKCSNITIEGVSIRDSKQNSGLFVIDSFGSTVINYCAFSTNVRTYSSSRSYAGGIHMQFTEESSTNVSIMNSIFQRNKSPAVPFDPKTVKITEWNGYSLGGGIGIAFINQSSGVNVYIKNCSFMKNKATWGGGLCVHFQDNTSKNTILVAGSIFYDNSARTGGGGVRVHMPELHALNTEISVQFHNITFYQNYAKFGGGVSVSAYYSNFSSAPGEILRFVNCTWLKNYGLYGPAVDVSPSRFQHSNHGFLPIPVFMNSVILENYISADSKKHVTHGVFVITRTSVYFEGFHNFEKNWYSALYITSGQAIFASGSQNVSKQLGNKRWSYLNEWIFSNCCKQ